MQLSVVESLLEFADVGYHVVILSRSGVLGRLLSGAFDEDVGVVVAEDVRM